MSANLIIAPSLLAPIKRLDEDENIMWISQGQEGFGNEDIKEEEYPLLHSQSNASTYFDTFTILILSTVLFAATAFNIYVFEISLSTQTAKCSFDLSGWLLFYACCLGAILSTILTTQVVSFPEWVKPLFFPCILPAISAVYFFWLILGSIWLYKIHSVGYYCEESLLDHTFIIICTNWIASISIPVVSYPFTKSLQSSPSVDDMVSNNNNVDNNTFMK